MSAPTIPPAATPADDGETLREAMAHTHSPSDLIAYANDLYLISHPGVVSTDADYPNWSPTKPKRIQRRRTKGWRKPDGAIYVGRGSEWGNPYPLADTQVRMPALDGSEWEHEGRLGKASGERHAFVHPGGKITWHLVQDATPEQVGELYRRWLDKRPTWVEDIRTELAGKSLMCWCPLDKPCHADVLLEIANGGESRG